MHNVVAAALYRNDQVLLARRTATRRWCPNLWDLPGGHLDGDETPWRALVRELREELSVDLSESELAPTPDVELVDTDMHLSIWRIDSWTGHPVNAAPDEHDLIGWFALRDALALPLGHPKYPAVLTTLSAIERGPCRR